MHISPLNCGYGVTHFTELHRTPFINTSLFTMKS